MAIILISKLLTITETYDNLQEKNKWDFDNYQTVSKTFIGQNVEITKRAWQYPPLYSILIIPTLFTNTVNYLLFLELVFSLVSFYFLFLFINMFISTTKSLIIACLIIFFDPSYIIIRIGMPISLSSTLFIIFIYYLYKMRSDRIRYNNAFLYCMLAFSLLILTKYLFLALIPFIAYWICINYTNQIKKRLILFFSLPTLFLSLWFLKNCLSYGFTVTGMLGGYSHIDINIYLIPNKLIFLVTDIETIWIMLFYVSFMLSYLVLLHYKDITHITNYYISFNSLLLIYFILTFIMFGFLYEIDGFRIRYFIYQTSILMALSFITVISIDERLDKQKLGEMKK